MDHINNSQTLVLVLEKDEEIVSSLIKFCVDNDISGAWLAGIGAVSQAELALYDLLKKEYYNKVVKGPLEIANLNGNIAQKGKETIAHIHAVLSDKNMKAYGGHLISATVAATCEIKLDIFDQLLKRKYNDRIGLNLIGD